MQITTRYDIGDRVQILNTGQRGKVQEIRIGERIEYLVLALTTQYLWSEPSLARAAYRWCLAQHTPQATSPGCSAPAEHTL